MRIMLTRLLFLFDARSKKISLLLLVMILVGTVFEMLSIGVVIPLITLFSSPDPLKASPLLRRFYDWTNPESQVQFIVWVLAGVVLLYVVKNFYLFLLLYFQNRFLLGRQYQLGCRLFQVYLNSPYEFHLRHNSSELLRNIKLVSTVIDSIFSPLILCVTELTVVVGFFLFLAWIDPISAIVVTVGLGIFLGGYFSVTRKKMTSLGEESNLHEGKTYQQVYQSLGSIKEVKILGQEKFFNEGFSKHLWEFTHANRLSIMISQSGRFVAETVTIGLILVIMIFLLLSGEKPHAVLVTFSLFAVAAVRLIPSINRLNWSLPTIKFGIPSLNEVFSHLSRYEEFAKTTSDTTKAERIIFNNQIECRNISYKYENTDTLSLDAFTVKIPKKSTVALVGASGSGKSTAIDLILGLLKPMDGHVLVDGKDIHQSLFSWQRQIGYVPQSIYLMDDTIRNNVVFGAERELVNEGKVWDSLRLAQLDSFVKELPNGLNTLVGENGVRCSGGQRQRIGIARALYHDPQVLILDEATASLDNETESAFMDSIEGMSGEKTIILIAHRITTVKNADIIFFLSHGRITASGTYDYLFSESLEFRQMAQL